MALETLVRGVLMVALAIACSWSALAVLAMARLRMRARGAGASDREVSVLKPLSGLDPALEANLRSFFEQSHRSFELVLGVQDPSDPALPLARRLKAEYPQVACRIVVHDGHGINPKVANLRGMLAAVSHDLIVISDSNVAAPPDLLRELVHALDDARVGLAFSPIAGVGERTLGAALESAQLCGPVTAGMLVPTELFEHPTVVGKSMIFKRSVFERLGGFESVASVLAEDYVMGRMFAEAGYRVRLCRTPVGNVCGSTSVRAFLARQKRWAMMRLRLQPVAYALEPLTSPLQIVLLAWLAGHASPRLAAFGLAVTLLRDAALFAVLRGPRRALRLLLLVPLREVAMLGVWAAAPFWRHVSWRGHRLRLSAGTRLYAEQPIAPGTLLRIEA